MRKKIVALIVTVMMLTMVGTAFARPSNNRMMGPSYRPEGPGMNRDIHPRHEAPRPPQPAPKPRVQNITPPPQPAPVIVPTPAPVQQNYAPPMPPQSSYYDYNDSFSSTADAIASTADLLTTIINRF